ncbi:MAG: thiamine pyrophosphate-dependent enzyme [Planctomycetota bacterium]|nr:thiamine pyrophosphate-dependent enzyme [Planctomycetota bacterium]
MAKKSKSAQAAPKAATDPYAVGPLGLFQLVDETGREVLPMPALPNGLAVRLLEAMLFQRALDQRMLNLQRQGRIGFYGTAKGQEGAVLGSGAAFEEQDWLFPALREGAIALWRGMKLDHYIAQCFGNAADPTLGRQMPCHYSDGPSRYVSLSSPIGTQISHAAGAARAAQIKGETHRIVGGWLGDGATSSNDFHSGLNFAAVWKAPVVFVCQNNQWAISVPAAAQTASETFAVKASAYGMPGLRVDGNDVLACYVATKLAADRARRGEGPTFIECLTFRLGGHSSSDDPSKYRDEDVAKVWEGRDPLLRHRSWLVERGEWDDKRQEDFLAEAGLKISEAIERVEAAAAVPVDTLFTDVWAGTPALLQDQADRLAGEEVV